MSGAFDHEEFESLAASMTDAELEALCEDSVTYDADAAFAARRELRERAYRRAEAAQTEFTRTLDRTGVCSTESKQRRSIGFAAALCERYEHVEASGESPCGRFWFRL